MVYMNPCVFLCAVPCLQPLDSIFKVYLEVIQKKNCKYAERFDNTFYLKVSSLLSVTNEVHKTLDPLTTGS